MIISFQRPPSLRHASSSWSSWSIFQWLTKRDTTGRGFWIVEVIYVMLQITVQIRHQQCFRCFLGKMSQSLQKIQGVVSAALSLGLCDTAGSPAATIYHVQRETAPSLRNSATEYVLRTVSNHGPGSRAGSYT